jgi:formylmethanofuran:tetrahydromethanopterin formyltransferase
MDEGGIRVSVGEALGVFGGSVALVPESTLAALSRTAREAFVEAAEEVTGAVVFVVPDAALTADV